MATYPRIEKLDRMPSASELDKYVIASPSWNAVSGERLTPFAVAGIVVVFLNPEVGTAKQPGQHFYLEQGVPEYRMTALRTLAQPLGFSELPQFCQTTETADDEGRLVKVYSKQVAKYIDPNGTEQLIVGERTWNRNVDALTSKGELNFNSVKFATEQTASKAKNRLYRQGLFGLPKGKDLESQGNREKGHIVCFARYSPDYSNPAVLQMLGMMQVNGLGSLYGQQQQPKIAGPASFAPAPEQTNGDAGEIPDGFAPEEAGFQPDEPKQEKPKDMVADLRERSLQWDRDAFVGLTNAHKGQACMVLKDLMRRIGTPFETVLAYYRTNGAPEAQDLDDLSVDQLCQVFTTLHRSGVKSGKVAA